MSEWLPIIFVALILFACLCALIAELRSIAGKITIRDSDVGDKSEPIQVEFNWSDEALLVLETDEFLSDEAFCHLEKSIREARDNPKKCALILDAGIKLRGVVYRVPDFKEVSNG